MNRNGIKAKRNHISIDAVWIYAKKNKPSEKSLPERHKLRWNGRESWKQKNVCKWEENVSASQEKKSEHELPKRKNNAEAENNEETF